jgi:hypothetical protein
MKLKNKFWRMLPNVARESFGTEHKRGKANQREAESAGSIGVLTRPACTITLDAVPEHRLSNCPGEHQDAAQEHPVRDRESGNFAMLLEDGAGSDQHGTGPVASALSHPKSLPTRRLRAIQRTRNIGRGAWATEATHSCLLNPALVTTLRKDAPQPGLRLSQSWVVLDRVPSPQGTLRERPWPFG